MQSEVRKIPPAPRRVRVRPLLAHRWPLLAIGGTLVVLGCLIAWAMFLQSGGKLSFGPRLEQGPVETAAGVVTDVVAPTRFDGQDWDDVRYRFTVAAPADPGRDEGIAHELTMAGMCYVPRGSHREGDQVLIRVLAEDRNVHCIVGGVKHMHRQWFYARFWLVVMVVPGALILLAWLTGVFQLRHVMVHGDASVGRVLSVHTVPWVLPEMLRVAYEFRDHRARLRRNRHWVRAHGALGRRLRRRRDEPGQSLPVLHDRRMPQWNRLVLADDCLATAEPIDPNLPTHA